VLPALRLSVAEAARQLRVPRQALHRILSGRSAVTPEMALRLGRFCGNGPDLWLRMQQAHDLWRAREELRAELEKIPERAVR
jgi:addiction module HigA family antidote